MMRSNPWNPDTRFDWGRISEVWHRHWDLQKSVLLEKSPPHLCRSAELVRHFSPACFLLLLRDPLAICEALKRRNGMDWKSAAQRWLNWLELHQQCQKELSNPLTVYYEDFVSQPEDCCQRILGWLPTLQHLDARADVEAHAIDGTHKRPLKNMNPQKMARVDALARSEIIAELNKHPEAMRQTPYAHYLTN